MNITGAGKNKEGRQKRLEINRDMGLQEPLARNKDGGDQNILKLGGNERMVTLVPMAGGREFGANTDTCPPYRTACAAEWYHRYSVCELQLSCGRHHSARLSCQRKATILGQKQNMRNIRKGICELFLTTRKNLKPVVAKS